MADSEILREYLVQLGFSVDKPTEARFTQSLQAADKTIKALGIAVTATVAAMGVAFAKVVDQFDQLYFASQRTGASAENLMKFGYALTQIGGNASDAQSSLAELYKLLRTNPQGYTNLLTTLGVQSKDAKGGIRDVHEVFMDLQDALRQMPETKAWPIANQLFGQSYELFRELRDNPGELKLWEGRARAAYGHWGVDPDRAKDMGYEISRQFKTMQLELGAMVDSLAMRFGPQIMRGMATFTTWLQNHQGQIRAFFAALGTALEKIGAWLGEHLPEFTKFFDVLTTLITKLDPLVILLGLLGLKLAGIGGAGSSVVGMLASIAEKLGPVAAMFGALFGGAVGGNILGNALFGPASNAVANPKSPWDPTNPDAGAGNWLQRTFRWGARKVLGLPEVAVAQSNTASTAIPPEGRALLDAIAAREARSYSSLYGDSSGHPNQFTSFADHPRRHFVGPTGQPTSAAGRYQFEEATWDRIAKKYGLTDFSPQNQDIAAWLLAQETYRQRTGRDLATDLRSGDPNLVAAAGAALHGQWTSLPGGSEQGQGADEFVKRYQGSLDAEKARTAADASNRRRVVDPANLPWRRTDDTWWSPFASAPPLGAGPIDNSVSKTANFNQTTTVHISGATDAAATALQFETTQARLNGTLLTNLRSAVQ